MGSIPNQFEVINVLIDKGWISLRQMAALLGYKELRGIYPRQKGRNAIPCIRIGGISRVYRDDVIEALKTTKADKQDEAKVLISFINTGLRAKERSDVKGLRIT